MANSLIEEANLYLYGRTKKSAVETETCIRCGLKCRGFIDDESAEDYAATGFCQHCQERIFSLRAVDDV